MPLETLHRIRLAYRRTWLGKVCSAYVLWGIVFLLALLLAGPKVLG